MSDALPRPHTFSTSLVAVLATLTAVVVAAVSFASSARAAGPPDILLGTAGQFAVLAYDGVTNTGTTTVTGVVGSAPTTTVADNGAILPPGNVRRGFDQEVADAKGDLATAFGQAAGAQPTVTLLPADVGGLTLVGGTYNQASSLGLTGTVTLDGENDPSSVFVIQVGQDFTTAPGAAVVLTRGAQACHVYWQIGNSAVFDTGTAFKGNVLAYQDISALTMATFEGRLLTTDGAVTLDANTITMPSCAAATPATPTPTVTTPTTPAPTRTTPVRATPRPTATTPSRDRDDRGSADGSGGSGGSDGDGGSGTDGDDFADADGSTTSTPGLPEAGGPPWFLAPVGGLVVLAGIGLVILARSRRGTHRA